MPRKRQRITRLKDIPLSARIYLICGIALIVLPTLLSFYSGQTGKFLIYTGTRKGPFHESVVYIIRHGIGGAVGVIINQPVPTRDFRQDFPELSWNVDLYKGGPVAYTDVNFLLLESKTRRNGLAFYQAGDLSTENPGLKTRMDSRVNEKPYRLYLGYSGWNMFQLEREIRRGTWEVIDYDAGLMFNTPPDEVWQSALDKSGR